MYCKNCGTKLPENAIFCSVCGEPVDNAAPLPADPATLPQNTYPMKWHKFLIYFQLFAAALVGLYNAVVCFRMVFLGVGTFGPWNVIYAIAGVICVVLAVWAIYVRFRLAGFRRNGPKMYILFLAINCVFQVLNLVIAFGGDITTTSSAVGSVVSSVLMLVLTNIYYKKRAELFVN